MGALKDIRVLDLSRVLAGPWCGQILADLGADVIKVERPQVGDDTRMWGPPWMKNMQGHATKESGYYQCTNRNKYSIAIDIASKAGQDLIHQMIKDTDVLIENYKVGSLKKYGLDYETLAAINPQLVYCSITGFGQTGPRAQEPGYDFIIQGMSGLMSFTGEKDGVESAGPQKVGVAVVDIQTGLYATIAIQAALLARQHTGRGQQIDISLFDVQLAGLANQGMNYLTTGISPTRMGNTHPSIVPYQVFEAKDKAFIIACGNDKQFKDLCDAIGRSEWSVDPRFVRNQDRVKHREQLTALLAAHFLTHNAQHWVDQIYAAKVPVGLIHSVEEALLEPQVQAREMLVNIPHRLNQNFTMIASPIKLSATPVQYRHAPPELGEHTDLILSQYLSAERLADLQQRGIVGQRIDDALVMTG
ncbi:MULTISPECIES: CaiB/BaiF CoA-transferase family protein [unclassified Acinetobacter]|uniref:CaiB/BaiF CoA transferase family protein n=1 Tax=unclassified Acinetobacter TaxID=196816 RepID=UPI0029345B02|nr:MULTISPECIES: CaiB/BaiF CoA-transferase family protein [unclassified Acinetobacter]WOE31647.1 CaiB/BaiF CoA-transferase family protein [Acinetobacter sp. SAAs470]WOE37112.1 CaiB/BaiF CoA-transferase family protein [Acinetobacter sp. SAAs474]